MIEITHGEAMDLHLKGEKVWVMVPFDDTFVIGQLKRCRCFKDEAAALVDKVDDLIAESAEKSSNTEVKTEDPVVKSKRAPRGTRETRTTAKPKIDKGRIIALYKGHLKNGNWPAKKIADDVHCCEATVRNTINDAFKAGEIESNKW